MTRASTEPFRIADAARRERHVFVRDLMLPAMIGIHTHERGTTQPIRINVDLTVSEGDGPEGDVIESVVDYEYLVNRITAIVQEGHVNLVETLAERIAAASLEDERVRRTRVRVEKLEAIKNAASVGVEIERAPSEA
jgi:dihydroneopterin aldolase